MYYHSYDQSSQRWRVGLATSPDGFRWTKQGPIFEARAGCVALGWLLAAGCWPAGLLAAGLLASCTHAGLAPNASSSPRHPLQGGSAEGEFDARGAAGRCVVRDVDTKRFFMFYEGVAADGSRSIGVAVSDDGKSGWQRCAQPVLTGSSSCSGGGGDSGAWDAGDVGAPWAVSMAKGIWRLYYSGRQQRGGGAWQGIGMARSAEGGPAFQGAPTQFARHVAPAGGAP